jgi:hypothetical protein
MNRIPSPRSLLAASLAALLSLSAAAEESAYGRKAADAVKDRIESKDCAGAVAELKAGLEQELPEVALLAGAMSEHGACVRRDWNRAISFYVRAWNGGVAEAADRLAAGYAAPGDGADVAAALWWASRGRGKSGLVEGMPACTVSAAAAGDIDRFVAELQTWQPSRLATCNYVTGLMSTMAAEVKYPSGAVRYGVEDVVTVRFLPGVPRIEVKKAGSSAFQLGDFGKALNEVADRALRRYPQPGGIPADALVTVEYRFQIGR